MTRWTIRLALGLFLVAAGQTAWAADKEPEGKKLFLKYKCNSCHSIDAAGVVKKADESEAEEAESKKKPPDLSGIGVDKKADWIALFLQKKEKHEGELHPKKFRGTEKELSTIAAWLETMKTPTKKKAGKGTPEAKTDASAESKAEAKEEPEAAKAGSGDSNK